LTADANVAFALHDQLDRASPSAFARCVERANGRDGALIPRRVLVHDVGVVAARIRRQTGEGQAFLPRENTGSDVPPDFTAAAVALPTG
jgi:hypothetical protein